MSESVELPFQSERIVIGGREQLTNVASRPIARGELVCRFTGTLHSSSEMLARIARGDTRGGDDPLELGLDLYLDLDPGPLHFNHSCEPNAILARVCDLVALSPIDAGEQITFDYSTNCSMHNSYVMRFDCVCGARSCRRKIGNLATIPSRRLRLYFESGWLQEYIRVEAAELLRVERLIE